MLSLFSTPINSIPIIIATMTTMVIGGLWYTQLFKHQWSEYVGKDFAKEVDFNWYSVVLITITATEFVVAFGQYVFIRYALVATNSIRIITTFDQTVLLHLIFSIILWAAFVLSTGFMFTLHAARPLQLWLFNSTYWLLIFLVNALIFSLWYTL